MPRTLGPIPSDTAITNPQSGGITNFFRLRWQELIDGLNVSSSASSATLTAQTDNITPTNAFVTKSAGLYRVSYYMRKTQADGVGSSLTFTYGWTDRGVPVTESEAALTLDTTVAQQTGSKLVYADAASALTYAIAYSSSGPGQLVYTLSVTVEAIL